MVRFRSNLAGALIERGAKPGDKLAFYMRNRPEYVELLAAAYKARLTHVNVNYRYKADEVFYIFDNSDAQTVVYGTEFRDIIEQIRPRLPQVQTWVDRKSVVLGMSVSVRVDIGGRRNIKNKNTCLHTIKH